MLSAAGCTDGDWSGFYRLFSRDEWKIESLFEPVKRHLLHRMPIGVAAVAVLDDTKISKTGKKTPGVSYHRDSMSPPFRHNLIRAQRFAQLSLSVPFAFGEPAGSRSIPVDFRHAPCPPKPRKSAPAEQWVRYREAQRTTNLSHAGVAMIQALRRDIDQMDGPERPLITSVDGSYTNKTVLKNLPERTTLIGRIRKDAHFYHLPADQPSRGRKRLYGERAPTPEQIRADPSIPWQKVRVFATGRVHECEVKEFSPVLWKKAGAAQPLRIIVIRPLAYRLTTNSRLLYRDAAYLICTDLSLPIDQLIQAYFWRWDIEVNHRDEKQLIGVGEAQVRSPKSVERAPAFAVAMYSLLLLAHGLTYGFDTTEAVTALPKWRAGSSSPRFRVSTGEMLKQIRGRSASKALDAQLNFDDFEARVARHLKLPKSQVTLALALRYATATTAPPS